MLELLPRETGEKVGEGGPARVKGSNFDVNKS